MIEPKILYSRTAKDAVNVWRAWAEGPEVICEWGQIDGAKQVSRYTAIEKNPGKKNATTAEQQAVKEVAALYVKKIKEKYSDKLETAGEVDRIPPMLAKDYDAKSRKKLKWPVSIQKKFNGVRCLAYWEDGEVKLQTRRGDFYPTKHVAEQLTKTLPEGVTLDGELYIHGLSLQTITSLARKYQPGSENLVYNIYDVAHHEGSWEERLEFLNGCDESEHVVIAETQLADNHDDVIRITAEFVAQGYEGSIVRSHSGKYRHGSRSPDLLKVKDFKDQEFRIVGYKVGKGKYESCCIFVCATDEGKEFDCTAPGSIPEKRALLSQAPDLVGEMLKVKFFDWTDDKKPQFPVALAVRYPEDMS